VLRLRVSEFLPAVPKSEENRTQAVGKKKKQSPENTIRVQKGRA